MKKKAKIGLIISGISLMIIVLTILYFFYKPQRNIENEKPAYTLESANLYFDFTSNSDSSYIKYQNQILQITGKVIEFSIENNGATVIFINSIGGITCAFDSITMIKDYNRLSKIQVGDSLTLKGKCDGYDMIMGIVLSKCILL
jgi:hypothetical protein